MIAFSAESASATISISAISQFEQLAAVPNILPGEGDEDRLRVDERRVRQRLARRARR